MAKIVLCRGIQGSGKTTWAKQWVLEDPEHRVRFNNDDIRNMLGKYWVTSREHLVEVCIERDSKRENPIGEEVIRKTYERYKSIIESV